jgi:hypothetical protein
MPVNIRGGVADGTNYAWSGAMMVIGKRQTRELSSAPLRALQRRAAR